MAHGLLCIIFTSYVNAPSLQRIHGRTGQSGCWVAAIMVHGGPLQERREIEQALFSGQLMAVAATNALELGVDVGSLDITLHLGFPGRLIHISLCHGTYFRPWLLQCASMLCLDLRVQRLNHISLLSSSQIKIESAPTARGRSHPSSLQSMFASDLSFIWIWPHWPGFDMSPSMGVDQVCLPVIAQREQCAGSVASLWQQAGRAGRREQASTSIYIAFDGPLDQYYFQHPQQLFGRPIEQSQVHNLR